MYSDKPKTIPIFVSTAIGLIFMYSTAHGGELRSIELTDGSTVVGEVVSVNNGAYTVNTPKLGTITIKDTDIRAITSKGAGNSGTPSADKPQFPSANAGTTDEMVNLQKRIMNDPSMSGSLKSLQNDPAFKQILQDPEIVKAIQSGDLTSLQGNPKIQNLTQNPTVQQIYKQLGQ